MKRREPLRIGLLGAGGVAQVAHLPAYAKIPDCRVTAICDVDEAKARRVAARYNVPTVTESYADVLEREDVDAVDVCLPNHLHAEATVAALAAGKHVLCEKPFSRSSEEAALMVAAAKKHKRVLMSGFNHRYRDDARLLKRFVAKGELGKVSFAKAGWLMQPASWTGGSWREKKRHAGGGVLLDLGIQVLDLTLWLLGMPEVVAVSATARPRPKGESLETSAFALLRLRNEASIALEVSWGLLIERDFLYLNLFGAAGAALLHPLRLHKEMHGSLVNVTPAMPPQKNTFKLSYESELRHFVDCASTGRAPDSPGEEALGLLRILEAVYRSAVEEREVVLD